MRIPSVTAVPENENIPMPRSQSVGQCMRATQYNKDDIRYMLSQPLLHEMKPLNESRRRSSGTLSRPDIFYQVRTERQTSSTVIATNQNAKITSRKV